MSDSCGAMFRHMVSEAKRFGLEINIDDGPGWAGSGGPWIKPEQAAQKSWSPRPSFKVPSRSTRY